MSAIFLENFDSKSNTLVISFLERRQRRRRHPGTKFIPEDQLLSPGEHHPRPPIEDFDCPLYGM